MRDMWKKIWAIKKNMIELIRDTTTVVTKLNHLGRKALPDILLHIGDDFVPVY